jgi:hypothetical protein
VRAHLRKYELTTFRHIYAQASRDKLLLALCVLTLMAGDYEVKFDELAADLKMHCDK